MGTGMDLHLEHWSGPAGYVCLRLCDNQPKLRWVFVGDVFLCFFASLLLITWRHVKSCVGLCHKPLLLAPCTHTFLTPARVTIPSPRAGLSTPVFAPSPVPASQLQPHKRPRDPALAWLKAGKPNIFVVPVGAYEGQSGGRCFVSLIKHLARFQTPFKNLCRL